MAMPSKKRKDGIIRDIAHPLNQEMRDYIETKVLEKYSEIAGEGEDSELVQRRPIVAA